MAAGYARLLSPKVMAPVWSQVSIPRQPTPSRCSVPGGRLFLTILQPMPCDCPPLTDLAGRMLRPTEIQTEALKAAFNPSKRREKLNRCEELPHTYK